MLGLACHERCMRLLSVCCSPRADRERSELPPVELLLLLLLLAPWAACPFIGVSDVVCCAAGAASAAWLGATGTSTSTGGGAICCAGKPPRICWGSCLSGLMFSFKSSGLPRTSLNRSLSQHFSSGSLCAVLHRMHPCGVNNRCSSVRVDLPTQIAITHLGLSFGVAKGSRA